MSVRSIVARIDCDACGRRFEVLLDEARKIPVDWTLFDEAVDVVRGGDPLGDGSGCSVQDGEHLCKHCTKERDEAAPAGEVQ